jgi:holo-[acyl-carrier protein] synthase
MSSIAGIGIDLEEVSRIESAVTRYGEAFLTKLFSDEEISYCRGKHRPSQHYAARFAAKEAFSKALGTGWRGNFRWKDVSVENDTAGRPHLKITGLGTELTAFSDIHLSLTHTRTHVVAVVVIESKSATQTAAAKKETT